jgi:hypothetical protein
LGKQKYIKLLVEANGILCKMKNDFCHLEKLFVLNVEGEVSRPEVLRYMSPSELTKEVLVWLQMKKDKL